LGGGEVILLDTHIWFWWVQDITRLSEVQKNLLQSNEREGLGLSVISCWEIAMLVAKKRLILSRPVDEWMRQAMAYPGIRRLQLTPAIAVESTQLPDEFHADPADRIIVATARARDLQLVTNDVRIRDYKHVRLA
jgi:PIN domain nuclease of toxin-antitoxin system